MYKKWFLISQIISVTVLIFHFAFYTFSNAFPPKPNSKHEKFQSIVKHEKSESYSLSYTFWLLSVLFLTTMKTLKNISVKQFDD